MNFRSLDEYEEYIHQINEEHWEELTMAGDKQEEFNEMMRIMNEEKEEHHKRAREKNMTPTDADVSEGWNRLRKQDVKPAEILHKERKQTRILECTLDTEEYLGYLRGAEIIARLDNKPMVAGFYKGKYDKFVLDNTP